ncbi:hypothetical protein NEHOM01_0915 [Nematocida homosporus]|uniref:uncharacterized protein n=1 Tax=Nematocida homosporus TaxID=1912981 RepID=UPI002220AD7A|nr:uncharacterized protein NEHOM01_0915 [Nematocida homosporus]KAI5185589.1 hypothetical protein NEHOM01_0915 [Nematocida homosporus]
MNNEAKQAIHSLKQLTESLAGVLKGLAQHEVPDKEMQRFLSSADELRQYLEAVPADKAPPGSDLGIGVFSITEHLPTDSPSHPNHTTTK